MNTKIKEIWISLDLALVSLLILSIILYFQK